MNRCFLFRIVICFFLAGTCPLLFSEWLSRVSPPNKEPPPLYTDPSLGSRALNNKGTAPSRSPPLCPASKYLKVSLQSRNVFYPISHTGIMLTTIKISRNTFETEYHHAKKRSLAYRLKPPPRPASTPFNLIRSDWSFFLNSVFTFVLISFCLLSRCGF